jgi:hypothetical protein
MDGWIYYRMESKLYPRTKKLLSFLSYNKLIDDTTFQEIINTLDTIKNTNDKEDIYFITVL